MRKSVKKLVAIAMAAVMSCTALTATVSATWVQNDTGVSWQNKDGTYAKSKWITTKGNKYYIKSNGTRATGILSIKNKKGGKDYYYFDDNGVMQTGWQCVKGAVYYFAEDGKAAVGKKVIGDYTYKFSAEGKWNSKVYSKDGKTDVTDTVDVEKLIPVKLRIYGKVKKIKGEKPATVTINGLTYRTDADNIIGGSKQIYVFPEGNSYTEAYINIANCTDEDLECLKYFSDLEILTLVTCSKDEMLDKEDPTAIGTQGAFQTPSKITNLDFCYYMPKLKYVTINNAPYLNDISGLSVCKNLQTLQFKYSGIKNLDGLENVKTLTKFTANVTRLENLDGLKNCKNLNTVHVTKAYLSDIKGIKNKSRLQTIILDVNRRLTDISVISTCKNITNVSVNHCNSVMDWSALEKLPRLKQYTMECANKKSNAVAVRDALKKRGIQFGIFDALEYDGMEDAPHDLSSIDLNIYWDNEMINYKDIYATNYVCTCSYCKQWAKTGANWTGVDGADPAMVALGTYQK